MVMAYNLLHDTLPNAERFRNTTSRILGRNERPLETLLIKMFLQLDNQLALPKIYRPSLRHEYTSPFSAKFL